MARYERQWFDELDEVTVGFTVERNGVRFEGRRELFREVVYAKRGWATFLFLFQDFKKGAWDAPKFSIQRWRRLGDKWRLYGRVHVNEAHFRAIFDTIAKLDVDALVAAYESEQDVLGSLAVE